jgi:hypothetical protein
MLRCCSRCGIDKLPQEFNKDAKSKDGLSSRCRLCKKLNIPSPKRRIPIDPNNKICRICLQELSKENFYGKSSTCKVCSNHINKEWRKENASHLKDYRKKRYPHRKLVAKKWRENNKERYAATMRKVSRKYYRTHRDQILETNRKKYLANKKAMLAKDRAYKTANRLAIRARLRPYNRHRYNTDPTFRLRINISNAVNYALIKSNSSKNNISVLTKLGYSMQELKEHIEKQFASWMHWDNQGMYNAKTWDDTDKTTWTWQLDHIIPHSDLPYSSMDDDNFKKCWALENLRPYSAKQNVIDGTNRTRHASKKS